MGQGVLNIFHRVFHMLGFPIKFSYVNERKRSRFGAKKKNFYPFLEQPAAKGTALSKRGEGGLEISGRLCYNTIGYNQKSVSKDELP